MILQRVSGYSFWCRSRRLHHQVHADLLQAPASAPGSAANSPGGSAALSTAWRVPAKASTEHTGQHRGGSEPHTAQTSPRIRSRMAWAYKEAIIKSRNECTEASNTWTAHKRLLFLEETCTFARAGTVEKCKTSTVPSMRQTSQTTPCYRWGGCWVVLASLEFLKISPYFFSNRALYFKQERSRWPRCWHCRPKVFQLCFPS